MSNPRRTLVTRAGVGALTLKTNMVLRKGATFHSPTSPPSSPEPLPFRPPSLPRRSQTNLDDVVDAHRRRVALTLGDIDKTLSKETSSASNPALRDNSIPIPKGFIESTIDSSIMSKNSDRVLRPRPNRRPAHFHESDSGLGTSLSSPSEKKTAGSKKEKPVNKATAITRSAAARSKMEELPGLSPKATNRIYEHTLKPILAKPSLREFHPLVLDCPRRIQEKEIVCLRDVEKTLLLMAPERTKIAGLYLDFCLTTVRCIQATVEYLSDREQTRPRDLPYTNGYFIDLVDQIRQYAIQLADAKDKKNAGDTDEMDVDPTDEIKLHGGIQINGRPAELVRIKKNGKAISMATGEPVEELEEEVNGDVRVKRSASEELEDEEEIMRSMARRKKNASPEELAPKKCRELGCNKEFKRPCDLTKHEKTHSRPWKCPVPTCKYHEYGWPTEKEMDRHHNDKHSSAPPMYECLFKPCPYKSKRESNCKQHMEKAHGWTYVRTKTNGKKGSATPSLSNGMTLPTPPLQHIATPTSDVSMGVATPPDDALSRFYNIEFPTYLPADNALNLIPQEIQLDYSPLDNGSPSTDSSSEHNTAYQTLDTDFTLYEDIYTAPVHVPTPVNNVFNKQISQQFSAFTAAEICQPQPAPHFSPTGQGNAMLFTPTSLAEVDEGFEDFPAANGVSGSSADFVLFPSAGAPKTAMPSFDSLFVGEVPSLAAGYSQPSSQDFLNTFNVDWNAANFNNYSQH